MPFDINKCKPFDLERALAGDKVVTREGIVATQLTKFNVVGQGIYAVVNHALRSYNSMGSYVDGSVCSPHDLFMAPRTKKFEAWVNVYRYGIACVTYNTKKEAEECAGEGHIKTIKIETEIEI